MTTPAPAPAHATGSRAALASAVLVFVGGLCSAVQSRANGTLASVVHEPLWAAIFSFGSGWVLLAVVILRGSGRAALTSGYAAWRARALPAWMFFGGVIGGLFVAVQAYVVPIVGVALFLVAVVGGQTLSGLLVDWWGIGPGGRRPISAGRVLGCALALVGMAIAIGGRVQDVGAHVLLPVLLTLAIGSALAIQGAVNGRVNAVTGQPLVTTWINFSWGTLVLVLIGAFRAVFGTFVWPTTWAAPWWAFLGGALGIVFVAASVVAVRHLGILVVILVSIAGMLSGGLVLDLINPATRGSVTSALVIGVALTFVAVAAAGLAGRSRADRRR